MRVTEFELAVADEIQGAVSGVFATQTGTSVLEKRCGWVMERDVDVVVFVGDGVEVGRTVGTGVEVGAGIFSELGSPKTEKVEK